MASEPRVIFDEDGDAGATGPNGERLLARLNALIEPLIAEHVRDPSRRRAALGPVWEHCYAQIAEGAVPAAVADSDAALRRWLEPLVRAELAGCEDAGETATVRSGAMGTFIDAQLRFLGEDDVGPEPATAALDASAASAEPREPAGEVEMWAHPLVADAAAHATAEDDQVLLRNLRWMTIRDRGWSYAAIADEAGAPRATVRSGVRRARQAVRRIAQQRRRAAYHPPSHICPRELTSALDAWQAEDLDRMRAVLERARATHGHLAYFKYLEAGLENDAGDQEAAVALLRSILEDDDGQQLRAMVLNCLGYIADDRGDLRAARDYWTRSASVNPRYAAAHVNLLKNACDRRDSLDAHVCIDTIGALLSGGGLSGEDRAYLVRRLREHPDYRWARTFDAWQRGPERWIERYDAECAKAKARDGSGKGWRTLAAAHATAMTLLLILAGGFGAPRDVVSESDAQDAVAPAVQVAGSGKASGSGRSSGDRGGRAADVPVQSVA
jgi:tetratricopeptide (TPR) repeat protein